MALPERPLDPDAGSVRIASLWWTMALRAVGTIGLATLAAVWLAMTIFLLHVVSAAHSKADAICSPMGGVE